MNITLTDLNGGDIYILPHVPAGIEYPTECENETLNTLNGNIRIVGDKGLKKVEWSAIFPNKVYSWAKIGSLSNGYRYVDFLEENMNRKTPIRVVITDNYFRTLLNQAMTIDVFNWNKDKAQDISYSIQLTEFPMEKWNYLNSVLANYKTYAGLIAKSATEQALRKYGLL